MSKISKKIFFYLFVFLIIFTHQIIFQKFFSDNLGHDYEQFVPNLIFGKIWFQNNFLAIPWFAPSFCCGIPYFADPQSMFYSINQLVFLIFDPIQATKILFFILSIISFLGMFLLSKKLDFNKYTALLCASLFLFNGFFVYRAIIGHLAYLTYVFIPLFCFFLIKSFEKQNKKKRIVNLIISSFIFANFFHSGSGPIILIITTSIICTILLYCIIKNNFKIFFNFFLSLFLGSLISLSKIVSSLYFLSNFPRVYSSTEFNSIASYIKIFFSSFFVKPDIEYFNENVTAMINFGTHEIDFFISIIPLLSIFLLFFINKKIFYFDYKNIRNLLILLIIFFIPIFFNINLFDQNDLISKTPILKSTWVQFRWMAIYILPLIILSGFLLENSKFSSRFKKYISFLFIIILISQNYLKDNSIYIETASYNMKDSEIFNEKLNKNFKPRIHGPSALINDDGTIKKIRNRNDAFYYSFSPLFCYQPIFGYGLEKLKTKNIKFDSRKILNDKSILYYSNINESKNTITFFNPSCFLFPKENNCLPGDIFQDDEKQNLIKFLNYEKLNFNLSKIQIISNYISLISISLSLIILIYIFIKSFYRFKNN